ncbi:hypothetical protein [Campylobacter geochelonis]|uniref:Membrane protein n=1 Tax=Campylobacter geochelonis TaxID=1780362 RepID=A0A128ENQ4_9BACT|nr:hypothetical protein [Campylobacter geochelonis]QKF71519.1 hypothetical protein CGEO_1221 [Campylobacter geochelonis]CZE47928.1 membrane protein [Campylobacter geochelonis]CZE48474.1 membrane protein [Campylobacter geochelonis]CZE50797.1 membrane protein [Campylobacter geochelonis]
MIEKSEILDDYELSLHKEVNLSFYNLILAYVFMAAIIVLTVPTIYIRNEIYYISRDIQDLKTKQSVLLEENKALERKIEAIKFKNEILDPATIKLED